MKKNTPVAAANKNPPTLQMKKYSTGVSININISINTVQYVTFSTVQYDTVRYNTAPIARTVRPPPTTRTVRTLP